MSVYKPQQSAMDEAVSFMKEWDPALTPTNWGIIWGMLAMLMDCSPKESRPPRPDLRATIKVKQILSGWERGIDLEESLVLTKTQRAFFTHRIELIVAGVDWDIFQAAAVGMKQSILQ